MKWNFLVAVVIATLSACGGGSGGTDSGNGNGGVPPSGPNIAPVAVFSTYPLTGVAVVFDEVTLDARDSFDPDIGDSIVSYEWNFGDGTPIASGAIVTKQFSQIGEYEVVLTVTDTQSNDDSKTILFTVGAEEGDLTADFTVTTSQLTANVIAVEDVIGSAGFANDFLWHFGDGTEASGKQVSHQYAIAGNYDISLTITDYYGVQEQSSQTVTVVPPGAGNQPPVASFTRQISALSVNVNGSSSSDPDAGDTRTYAWNFGDGVTATGETAFHSYAGAGIYTITLVVTDSQGASDTFQQQVTVESANQAPIAVINIDQVTGAAPLQISVNASGSSDSDGSIDSYRWSFGEGDDSFAQNSTYTYHTVGQFTLTLTVTDNQGGQAMATKQISVNNNSSPFTLLPLGDSITQSDSGHQSYRYPLWKLLLDGGLDVDFIGSSDLNVGGNPVWPDHSGQSFDQDHEGHWGLRADEVYSILQTQTYVPDIVLMHLGSNDFLQGQSDDSTEQDFRNIITNLRSKNAAVIVLFAQLIPMNGITPSTNAVVAGLAAELSTVTSPIVVVDQNSGFISSTDTHDGIHPNASGEAKMAQRWYDAIVANLP